MQKHGRIVSRQEWTAARRALLEKEKELTRRRDELARERQQLPWVRVEKPYVFDAPGGKRTLAELFAGRSQLVVYHFMFGPEWKEGCPSCSLLADHVNGALPHLAARDTTLTLVSRAPLERLEAFRERMGWRIPWVSSQDCDFNTDFGVRLDAEQIASGSAEYNYEPQTDPVEEAPGLSVFAREGEGVFHTYSAYARGLEDLIGAYVVLDRVPRGRNEGDGAMGWVRHHDRYDTGGLADMDHLPSPADLVAR